MTSQQLSSDLQVLINAVQFVQGILPNAVSADMLKFLQFVQGDQSIMNFVTALINTVLPQQPAPTPAPSPTPAPAPSN